MFSIDKVMKELSVRRKVYFSERELQIELALIILSMYVDASISVEVPFDYDSYDPSRTIKAKMDLVVEENGRLIPIELKYRTKKQKTTSPLGEPIELKNQYAHDDGCYGFAKDIERIESFKNSHNEKCEKGYTIFLTNDSKYKKDCVEGTNYSDFCINSLSSGYRCGMVNGKQRKVNLPSFKMSSWKTYKSKDDIEFFYLWTEI